MKMGRGYGDEEGDVKGGGMEEGRGWGWGWARRIVVVALYSLAHRDRVVVVLCVVVVPSWCGCCVWCVAVGHRSHSWGVGLCCWWGPCWALVAVCGVVGWSRGCFRAVIVAWLCCRVVVVCGCHLWSGPPSSVWWCDVGWVDRGGRGLTRLWPSPFVAIGLHRVDATSPTVTWPRSAHVQHLGLVTWHCHAVAVVVGMCRGRCEQSMMAGQWPLTRGLMQWEARMMVVVGRKGLALLMTTN
jgi:hypothetical protein